MNINELLKSTRSIKISRRSSGSLMKTALVSFITIRHSWCAWGLQDANWERHWDKK